MRIPRPTSSIIDKYLSKWDSLENYVLQESSLDKLFLETYTTNNDMDDVLIKVCSLNAFYSTNIFSPFIAAKHIVDLNIDDRLRKNDLTLVNDIANIKVTRIKTINFYSFASKYCSHHRPDIYPIYDSYVDKLLMFFKRTDNFSIFHKNDLKNYAEFNRIIHDFQNYYKLGKYSVKEIDKFLWQAGKHYFPKKYK